jgi:DNA-directed RNA polymerase II subunit RPB1
VSTSLLDPSSHDPNISVEELGVPLKIAMIETFRKPSPLTTSTACATWSSTVPTTILERGMWQNGISIDLRRAEKRIRMEISEGDVVDRHLLNGDYVLFNRQPSLHRMSMMAHKVRVMPYDTFHSLSW